MCEFCEETKFKRVDGYEKGKNYTKRTKSIAYSRDYELNEVNGMILVIDEDRENRLYFDNSSWEYARGYIKINYCPICGRKLVQRWLKRCCLTIQAELLDYFLMANF